MAKATAAQIAQQKKKVAQAEEQLKTAHGDEKPAFQKQLDNEKAALAALEGDDDAGEEKTKGPIDYSALTLPPEEPFTTDDRTRELLRLINYGERNICESLDQMIAASKGSETGADALYADVKRALGEICAAIRNCAGHQAIAMAKK